MLCATMFSLLLAAAAGVRVEPCVPGLDRSSMLQQEGQLATTAHAVRTFIGYDAQ